VNFEYLELTPDGRAVDHMIGREPLVVGSVKDGCTFITMSLLGTVITPKVMFQADASSNAPYYFVGIIYMDSSKTISLNNDST
jgi:hypothetical protein